MTKSELNNRYFDWLYGIVCGSQSLHSYRKLCMHLHGTDFAYTLEMDGNRADDGIELRYKFGKENDIEPYIIASFLDERPCSILEMLAALSVRCEVHIMGDPSAGDHAEKWFGRMICNLGLDEMYDSRYNRGYVDNVLKRFINRTYERNGKGGLFVISDSSRDMRSADIWYQMMWYLDEILENERGFMK